MLGKKLSSGTSSKGRNSLSGVHQTSSTSATTSSGSSATAVFQQSGILPPPAAYRTEIVPPLGVTHIKTNENFKMLPRYSAGE